MTIIELALINIRNFREARKFPLRPGLNILVGDNGSGKSTLFDVVRGILFNPNPRFLPDPASQAALSFRLNDGQIFRLLRHFSKDTLQLLKYDAATSKFNLLEKEDAAIRALLFPLLHISTDGAGQLLNYFSLDRSQLPSMNTGGIQAPLPVQT